jgi:hypothetical protein
VIQSLRRRHRVAVCTLGLAFPVLFAAGITARRPLPVAASIPSELTGSVSRFGNVLWARTDLWRGQKITTILRDDSAGIQSVEFNFRKLVGADVLVYWARGKQRAGDGFPEDAQLLGAFADGAILSLPPNARGEEGRFILYSLAEHELVTTSEALVLSSAK